MNNVVVLYKTEEGILHCRELSDKGRTHLEEINTSGEDEGFWKEIKIIQLEDLDEILNKQI